LIVSGGRGDVMIPLAAEICVSVDPAAHRIVVNPPEGLLELNTRDDKL
jgi:ribosomal 30S subunit maturation factor RimM